MVFEGLSFGVKIKKMIKIAETSFQYPHCQISQKHNHKVFLLKSCLLEPFKR